jgi:trk system potassium uptake protein TrkH
MVFSAAAVLLLGKRLSVVGERAAVDLVGASGRDGLTRSIREIFAVTFVTEGVGALLLAIGFVRAGDGVAMAIWRGVFTSISAFCNAGFALQTESLVPYAQDPYILSVVGGIIILGGLGPVVVVSAIAFRSRSRWSLHTKLVLASSAVLLIGATLIIGVIEWENALAGLSARDKVLNAAFQSVTLRTAGFNSIDLAQLHPATWTMTLVVMFIGGSPGSTAGGVKTTTFALICLILAAVIRGRARVEVFGRALPNALLLRAAAIVTLATLSSFVALMALQLTQRMPLDVAIFEVISALATVGLSIGGTGLLDEVGKVIIILCMFAGRLGPLTLFVFIVSLASEHATRRYPEEGVSIG